MTKPIATLFLLLTFAGIAAADQPQTLVFNGESLKLVSRSRQPTCDRWEIWFYTRAGTLKSAYPLPGEPGYRGAIWGKTSSNIQNQVDRIQKFQRAYEKVAGLPTHDDFWDHPLGPICATPPRFPPSQIVLRELQQADKNQIQFSQIWNNLGNAFTNTESLPADQVPRFRNTMGMLSKAFEKNNNLHNLTVRKTPPSDAEISSAMYDATDAIQRAYVSASDSHATLADSGKTPVWLESKFIITDPAFTDTYQFAEIHRGVSLHITRNIPSKDSAHQTTSTTIAVLFSNIARVDPPKFDSEKLRWGVRVTGRSVFTGSASSLSDQTGSGAIRDLEVYFRFDDKKDAEACYFYLVHHRQ